MNLSSDLTPKPSSPDANDTLIITLYIAGNALNSLRALTNLKAICEKYFPGGYQLEVVDVFEHPLRALADKVLLTPTLVKTTPEPRLTLVGDLSATETVLLALQGADSS